jgi:hypothetical protein
MPSAGSMRELAATTGTSAALISVDTSFSRFLRS